MREYFPVIKKSALFQGISEDDLDGMLTCLGARTASYSKNQPIFWEGEPASLIGVVLTRAKSRLPKMIFSATAISFP